MGGLEAAWGWGCTYECFPWVVLGRAGGHEVLPSPRPSPGSVRLLQAKNMDYYKREVSGVRGWERGRPCRAQGLDVPCVPAAGPRSSTAGRPWPGPG